MSSTPTTEPQLGSGGGTTQLDRRTLLKTGSGVLVAVSIPSSLGTPAAAATEYDASISATGEIPSNTAIEVTVTEYESNDASSEVDSEVVSVDAVDTSYSLTIPASSEYYDFRVGGGSNEDGRTPDVAVLFEVVETSTPDDSDGSDDSDNSTSTTVVEWVTGTSGDGGFFSFSFWSFGSATADDETENSTENTTDGSGETDGGLFDFDFWSFFEDDDNGDGSSE